MDATWRPIHEAHSISEMVLALELNAVPAADILVKLAAAKSNFPELPGANVMHGLPMPLGFPPFIPQSMPQPPVVGVTFDRYTQAGTIGERLIVQANYLAYTTTEYSRWANVSPVAFRHLAQAASFLSDVSIRNLSLRYTDKFIWSDKQEPRPRASTLLRLGGRLVAARILDTADQCHSHCGFFQTLPTGSALVNVNVDITEDPNLGRVASILTLVRSDADPPLPCTEAASNQFSRVIAAANDAHNFCNESLCELLVDEVAARIGLRK